MAKKHLVIVESPAKAKTIGKYMGREYEVKASMGHLRDLPKSKLGVDIEHDFEPVYQPIRGKEELIGELKKAAKDSDTVVTGRSVGGPVRCLKNKMTRQYLTLEKQGASLEELEKVTLGGLRRAVLEGDMEYGSVMSGQVAGMVHKIKPVRQIFEELYAGGRAVLEATNREWQ